MALINCHFFSHALGMSSTMNVILPESAPRPGVPRTRRDRQRHPTLYLLHGLSDDHTTWLRRTAIERYVEGLGLAVVMPAVNRSYYANTVCGEQYWTFLAEELPRLARGFFPLSDAPDENFVAGLSMGGYGAFKLALSYPDRYAAAASLSGAVDIVRRIREDEEVGDGPVKRVFGGFDRLVDSDDDLFFLARRLADRSVARPALYQWCGTEDFLYGDNLRFRDYARGCGLSVTYEEGAGGHDWSCWDRQIERVLGWLPGVGT